MNEKIMALLFILTLNLTHSQNAIGTTTPHVSAILDITSTTGGLLIPRTTEAQRDAIVSPADGLIIYNTTTNCVNFRKLETWQTSCIPRIDPSTNGSGTVSDYICTTASAGCWLKIGMAVSGVSQTITATVTKIGTYDISATAGGVTFSAAGTFLNTGVQNIVLTASGTPNATGNIYFTLNVTPSCNFSRYFLLSDDVCSNDRSIWKDKNAGAIRVATAANDTQSFGTSYNHAESASACPAGYSVPTLAQLRSMQSAHTHAFNSPLKIPTDGISTSARAALRSNANQIVFWSSQVTGSANVTAASRFKLRCRKN